MGFLANDKHSVTYVRTINISYQPLLPWKRTIQVFSPGLHDLYSFRQMQNELEVSKELSRTEALKQETGLL